MCHGQQSSDFWAGAGRIFAPAAGFPNIDEFDNRRGAASLLRKLYKQPLFLGAGDDHIITRLNRFLKSASFAPAKRRMQAQVFIECRAQLQGLKRHGLVAVANESGHDLVGWRRKPELARVGWGARR